MKVQMRHGLPSAILAIHDQAIAIAKTERLGQPYSDDVEVPHQIAIGFRYVCMGGNDLARDEQDVNGRLRIDVMKRHAMLVFVNDSRGDLLLNDLQKNVVGEHGVNQTD